MIHHSEKCHGCPAAPHHCGGCDQNPDRKPKARLAPHLDTSEFIRSLRKANDFGAGEIAKLKAEPEAAQSRVATADRIIGQLGNDKAALQNALNAERDARQQAEQERDEAKAKSENLVDPKAIYNLFECPHCNGSGLVSVIAVVDGELDEQEAICGVCAGSKVVNMANLMYRAQMCFEEMMQHKHAKDQTAVLIEKLAEEQAKFMQSIDRRHGAPYWIELDAEEQAEKISRCRRGIIADLPAWVKEAQLERENQAKGGSGNGD